MSARLRSIERRLGGAACPVCKTRPGDAVRFEVVHVPPECGPPQAEPPDPGPPYCPRCGRPRWTRLVVRHERSFGNDPEP